MSRIRGLSNNAVNNAMIKGTEIGKIKKKINKINMVRIISDHWRLEIARNKLMGCLLSL